MRDNSKEAVERRCRERGECLRGELQRMLTLIKNQPGVKSVILFGSLARGDARFRSDLDLIIIQDTPKRFMDRLDEFYRLLEPRVATDIFVYTPDEWDELSAIRPFVRNAKQNGKVLYESQAA